MNVIHVVHTLLNPNLQSDTSTIAEACEVWPDLLVNDILQPFDKMLKKRFDQAMIAVHFLDNILHSKFRGNNCPANTVRVYKRCF